MREEFDVTQVTEETDFVKEMEEWEKNRNPIVKWIDTWFGGSLAGYRVTSALIHPHWILAQWGRDIKWAWQRIYRGWDDRAAWSVDYWLNNMMPDILRRLKKYTHGVPMSMYDNFQPNETWEFSDKDDEGAREKWNKTLDKIILGFEASQKLSDLNYDWENEDEEKQIENTFKDGLNLFVKHYHDLWD